MARSEKFVYDYYGLWLGKPSPGQKLLHYAERVTLYAPSPTLSWQGGGHKKEKTLVTSIFSFSHTQHVQAFFP